jgi:hypothetical protein
MLDMAKKIRARASSAQSKKPGTGPGSCRRITSIAPNGSMARRADDLLQGVPCGIRVTMLARHADPCLLRRASAVGLVVIRVDLKERYLAVAALQLVRVHVDHQSTPVPFPSVTCFHHVERKPSGRRVIKNFDCCHGFIHQCAAARLNFFRCLARRSQPPSIRRFHPLANVPGRSSFGLELDPRVAEPSAVDPGLLLHIGLRLGRLTPFAQRMQVAFPGSSRRWFPRAKQAVAADAGIAAAADRSSTRNCRAFGRWRQRAAAQGPRALMAVAVASDARRPRRAAAACGCSAPTTVLLRRLEVAAPRGSDLSADGDRRLQDAPAKRRTAKSSSVHSPF